MSEPDAPPVAPARTRPVGLLVAVGATWALALFFAVLALLALTGGHGQFSGLVAVGLLAWAVAAAAAGLFLWRRAWWSRGPVVALGLLHLLAFGQSTAVAPWAILGAAAGLAAVVGGVLPGTRAALARGVSAS